MQTADIAEKCAQCGSPLAFRVSKRPAFGTAIPAQEVRYPEPCRVCEQRAKDVHRRHQDELNRAKWIRESGLELAAQVRSLDPGIWPEMSVDGDNLEALDVLREWVTDASSLYVYGAPGTGKTTFAQCAAMDCLRLPRQVLWLPEWQLFQLARANSNPSRRTEASPIEAAQQADVLVLDDLGRNRLTDFMREAFYAILDVRSPSSDAFKKTLITSQMPPAKLAQHFADEGITGRLWAMLDGQSLELAGRDRRARDWSSRRPGGRP